MYLSLFEDFDRAGKYAWGAAALAFLYRALGNATTKSQSTISGCLTLLQCWRYSHLNIGRPKLCQVSTNGTFPLALLWKQKQTGQRVKCNLVQYRKVLDSLQPHDVDWLPYKNVNRTIPEGIKLMLILGRSKTTLLCFDKSEKRNPDRCLRQFGIRQPIPQALRVDTEVDTLESPDSSCSEWLKRQDNIVKGGEGADCNEYYQWYSKITRRYVGRHMSLESVFRQTVAGMTKMLELANTLSRDDMTSKNKEIIANIRSTLTKSLKNPIACAEDIFPARSAKKRKQKDT
ncbi:hypothetical protein K2173_024777 [Erythroxylum novogranatense]|uniref:Aminotransferase-like plant mobile domain-containing protein n=1 Tax=Erythroxylum novogranatense TaxID=1862640 RepID=A0AAV8SW39_9ROSI|nr:hypothetical protein K2173_024777 [Erythroxylum novogranatense]